MAEAEAEEAAVSKIKQSNFKEVRIIINHNVQTRSKKDDDYIDVAKNADYQNQSHEYYREFLNWRSSGDNPYAYSFVRRKNEYSYVDGKGYVSNDPGDKEKKVLKRCCRLIAMTMFTIILFSLAEMFYVSMYYKTFVFSTTKVLYGQSVETYDVPMSLCLGICLIRSLKYIIPTLIFILDTRIPGEVFLPKADKMFPNMTACAFVMALMAASFCRISNDVLAYIAEKIGIGVYRFDYMYSSNPLVTIAFGFCNCILLSVLSEVLFRGLILQTMRQFGDMFAFIICCVTEAFCGFDILGYGSTICIGIIITLFTLRTGSIKTAIGMRISATTLFFLLDTVGVYLEKNYAMIAEAGVCLIIIAISLVIYSRVTLAQNFSFNVNNSKTHLSIAKKLSIFFSHSGIMLWLIIVLTVALFSLRFV